MSPFTFHPQTTEYNPENAYWMGKAAELAYLDEAAVQEKTVGEWGFKSCTFLDKGGTQGFVAGRGDMILVAFRGTEPTKLEDIVADADIDKAAGSVGMVHRGFKRALDKVWEQTLAAIMQLRDTDQPIWFTGHSLGAALATLAVGRTMDADLPVQGIYTFGQPRVGGNDFATWYDKSVRPRAFRCVNNNDMVTRVPLRNMGYRHVGTFVYFDSQGSIHKDIRKWELFQDRIKGLIEYLGKPGTDGLKDHFMKKYLHCLGKNIKQNPFV